MTNAIVLGGGMVGSAMAADLAADAAFSVTVADRSPTTLASVRDRCGAAVVRADLADPAAVAEVVSGHDIVLGALSSHLGLRTMRAVIEAGKPYCDISFMEEDPRSLGDLARETGVTVVYDCGVAPGMSNLLAGHAAELLDPCERIDLYVGGLPADPRPPYHYKAGFAPRDVIAEYTRPARLVEDGEVVVRAALSQVEPIEFAGVGTLEAFNTDGLRSLVDTLGVPWLREKTIRYPGHADLVRALRDTGLFSEEPVDAAGVAVRPLDLTAAVLFPLWKFDDREADLTVLRATAEGLRDGVRTRLTWELLDRYDPATDTRSMSRTTAFPATIMARMIASGRFRRPGVHPPEIAAREPGLVDAMLSELGRRGVRYTARAERID